MLMTVRPRRTYRAGRRTPIEMRRAPTDALGVTLTGLCLVAASLSACAPDLGPAPRLAATGAFATDRSLQAPASDWPSDRWWAAYDDPQLDALIDEALHGSPDLRSAEARVRSAQALVEQADAAKLPSLNGDAGIQTTKQSLNEGYPPAFQPFLPAGYHTQTRVALDLTYQLDFFGRNRAALAAATSSAEAAQADEAAARLQLSTAVASSYADLVRLYAERDTAVDAVDVRRKTLGLVAQRLSNGLDTRGTFSLQAETVPTARGDVEAIDRQITGTRHALAALVGAGPDRGLAIARPAALKLRPFGLPATLKVDLVGRRPDIVAARLRAEAARQRIKVAKADFYPNVDLQADYGVQSLGINYLLEKSSIIGAIGPAIRLPIFAGGRLKGAYRGARAEYDAAVASYDQTLTDALRDVADVVANQRALQVQIADAQAAVVSAEDAYRIASLRYQGGLSPFLDVLTAENGVIATRRSLVDLQSQGLSLDIALVRGLGGGFGAPQRLAAR